MKLALHTSYGSFELPKGFTYKGNTREEQAESLAEWILSNKDIPVVKQTKLIITDDSLNEVKAILDSADSIGIVKLDDVRNEKQFYYVKNACSLASYTVISRIDIVDVNTDEYKAKDIVWRLTEEDGFDYIEEFICGSNNVLHKYSETSY